MTESQPVTLRGTATLLAGGLAGLALAAVPASAQDPAASPAETTGATGAQAPTTAVAPPAKSGRLPAKIRIHLSHANGGAVHVGRHVVARGLVRPFAPGQHVVVVFTRNGHPDTRRIVQVHRKGDLNAGGFRLRSGSLVKPGTWRVRAYHSKTAAQAHDTARSRSFHIVYPDLNSGDRGHDVRLFEDLLARRGYYTPRSGVYDSGLERAVMAFRKVNGMPRTWDANPSIFRTLADGRGGFQLAHPGAGRHVEVDISRQVMALADHGKAQYVFHVSTGAPATPTIRGLYHFYSRQPGYNSEGMYYSTYWHGGYAVHGYASVPPYNASHGCVRVPIPNAKFIYDWIQLGEAIYVYN